MEGAGRQGARGVRGDGGARQVEAARRRCALTVLRVDCNLANRHLGNRHLTNRRAVVAACRSAVGLARRCVLTVLRQTRVNGRRLDLCGVEWVLIDGTERE